MKNVFLLILVFCFGNIVNAQTSVWKATNGTKTIYFGSDFGKMKPEYYPLPFEYYTAYNYADVLVVENNNFDYTTAQKLENLELPNDETLQTFLGTKTTQRIDSLCKYLGVEIVKIEKLSPNYALSYLGSLSDKKNKFTANRIENYFRIRAGNAKKETKYFFDYMEEVSYFETLTKDAQILYINRAITNFNEESLSHKKYYKDWLKGNTKSVEENLVELEKTELDYYNFDVKNKNNLLFEKLKVYMASNQVEFMLLSRINLLGKDGIFELLKKENFTIEQITF